jgi:hypothetical protein
MNDLMHTEQPQGGQLASPFNRNLLPSASINAGAVAIETERAIAEAQGQLTLAKRFPRSRANYMTEFLDTCASPEFAQTAFYAVPNRGSGPSIRFAEEAARCYGNFQYGHRELSRIEGNGSTPGRSEVEVYAWDMQNNNYSKRQITVLHVVDTKNGPKVLRDQTDIDNKIANVASKQMRGRILALLPKDLIAAGQERAKLTLAGGGEKPLRDRIVAMTNAFARFGVNTNLLTKHLGHAIDDTTIDELADLLGIFNAIKEGAKPSEYFSVEEPPSEQESGVKALAEKAKQAAAPAPAPKAAPKSNATESKGKAAKEPAQELRDKAPVAQKAEEDNNPPPPEEAPQQDEENGQQGEDVF